MASESPDRMQNSESPFVFCFAQLESRGHFSYPKPEEEDTACSKRRTIRNAGKMRLYLKAIAEARRACDVLPWNDAMRAKVDPQLQLIEASLPYNVLLAKPKIKGWQDLCRTTCASQWTSQRRAALDAMKVLIRMLPAETQRVNNWLA